MTYQKGLDQIKTASDKIVEANELTTNAIMDAFLFTWQWWVALGMIIIPWVVWFIVRNRNSSARIFSAGLLLMVLSEVLDIVGVGLGKWTYPVKVIPIATVSFSFRLSVLPVFAMLLMQIKPNWNPFLKGIIFGGLGAYAGLPLLSLIDLYKKYDWPLHYSFLILTVMYLLSHWFSRRKSFHEIQ